MLTVSSCSISRELWFNMPNTSDQYLFDQKEWEGAAEEFPLPLSPLASEIGAKLNALPAFFATETISLDEYLEQSKTEAFIVLQRDTIVYERYFNGKDRQSPVTSFSVAKSFVGVLIGIAIEEGLIGGENDPLSAYFPELLGTEAGKVQLKFLLDQNSGLAFPRDSWQYYSKDLGRITEKVELDMQPGQRFKYENGNSQLLAMIIEQQSGMDIGSYFHQKIWSKIGTEAAFGWSVDSDKNGMAKAYCCVQARARDFARLGRLFLHNGNWQGEQLIPADWMKESSSHNRAEGAFIRYNNQFWLESQSSTAYAAIGLYGQYIYVCPAKEIVIVRFAKDNVNINAVYSELFSLITEQL